MAWIPYGLRVYCISQVLLAIGSISSQPARHMMLWFQVEANKFGNEGSCITEFVTFKMDTFLREWQVLLKPPLNDQWSHLTCALEDFDEDARPHWMSQAALYVLEMVCDFTRRFAHPCRTYPLLIFWLRLSPPEQPCPERQKCAQDLLFDNIMDETTCKFRDLWLDDLADAIETGCLSSELWTFLEDLDRQWPLDTQVIEGCNSVLRRIVDLSPGISWPLASARLQNKKTVTNRIDGKPHHQQRQAYIRSLQDEASFFHYAACTYSNASQNTRFAPIDVAHDSLPDLEAKTRAVLGRSERFAAAQVPIHIT